MSKQPNPKNRKGICFDGMELTSLIIIIVCVVAGVTGVTMTSVMASKLPLGSFASQATLAAGEMPSLDISYQSDAVVTVGDHSYIPILPKGSGYVIREDFPQTVLKLIDAFEQDHPELNVTGWKLLTYAYGGTYVHTQALGIFLDHQPRQ